MIEKTISINVPESAYRKLQRAAELTYRSVDEVLVSTIESGLPVPPDAPPELGAELAAMHLLSDDALWAATKPSFSPTEQTRLLQLNDLAGERELTPAEIAEQKGRLAGYYRSVLRRAQALTVLAQRGHPISLESLPLPESPQ